RTAFLVSCTTCIVYLLSGSFCFSYLGRYHLGDLHSFPTRRSSDLAGRRRDRRGPAQPLLHRPGRGRRGRGLPGRRPLPARGPGLDRKSTRLNSSHVKISYAVFCLKKKITISTYRTTTFKKGP